MSAVPADGVVDTAAVLNATVNPQGIETTYFFEYTTDAAYQAAPGTYQTAVPGGDAGSGSAGRDVSAQLNGLQPNTTYHFRVDASDGTDLVQGADQTFTTAGSPSPPAVDSVQAASITDTTAAVSGTVNPEGQSTSYHLEYGLDSGYGTDLPLAPPSVGSGSLPQRVTATLTNLAPHTTYHYAIVAGNASGTSSSADQTFTTTTPPAATTGSAADITGGSATVSGTANANGNPSTVYFQYGTSTAYGRSTLGQSAQGSTEQPFSASLSGLSTGTPYHFRIVAVNGPDIVYGADQTLTTLAPPVLGSGSVEHPADSTALLDATVNPSGQATQYYVNWGTDTSYSSGATVPTALAQNDGTQPVQIALNGLTADTTYHFQLVASNSAGTTFGPDQVFTTPMPPDVSTSAPSAVTDSSATLNGAVTTHGFSTTYHFEYASPTEYAASAAYPHTTSTQTAADATTQSADISQLAPGTTYHYRLIATNGTDTIATTDQTFTTTTPPAATTGAAGSVTGTSATVSGTANANGDPSTVYFQYGPSTAYGSSTPSQSLSGNTDQPCSATLAGLLTGTGYHYRIVAVNGPDIVYGADQTLTTLALPIVSGPTAAATGDTAVTLGGTVNPSTQTTTYHFNYGTGPGYGSATASQTLDAGTTAQAVGASVTGLRPNTTYHVQLAATNTAGTALGPDQVFTTPMAPAVSASPAAITNTSAMLQGSITPNGFSTTYRFEYASATEYASGGPAGAYPHTTPAKDLGSGLGDQAEFVAVYQLQPSTIYHFRLVASQGSEAFASPDQTFSTAPAPPPLAATTLSFNVADSTATAAGLVNPRGYDTTYRFQYGTSPNFGSLTAPMDAGAGTAPIDVSAPLTGLTQGTTYYFRTVAVNSAGTAFGGTLTFTTSGAPAGRPGTIGDGYRAPLSRAAAVGGSSGPGAAPPTITLSGPPATTLRSDNVPVLDSGLSVTCPPSSTYCHVTVQVTTVVQAKVAKATKHRRAIRIPAHRATLGSATVMVLPGHTSRVQITLRHSALTMLRASHRLSARVTVALAGTRRSRTRTVLLTLPRTASGH